MYISVSIVNKIYIQNPGKLNPRRTTFKSKS